MNKLTIYLVSNEEYFHFTKVFLLSLKDNMPLRKIKAIVINDLGLTESQKEKLSEAHELVEFIKTSNEKVGTGMIHSKHWRKAVNHKTQGLYSLCENDNYPILMIDVDTFVLKDFSEEIFYGCDVQVCKQTPLTTSLGTTLGHIGCWFVAHNDKAKEFIYRWRKKMELVGEDFKETPALCKLIEQLNSSENTHFTVKENHENFVCSLDYNFNPKILHFRSNPSQKVRSELKYSIEDRIDTVKNLPPDFKNKVSSYLEK